LRDARTLETHAQEHRMRTITLSVLLLLALSACGERAKETSTSTPAPRQDVSKIPPPASQNITLPALEKIDPAIARYSDAVAAARRAHTARPTEATKAALLKSLMAFGDYLQYDSPVSPRQGKYRRALLEYRRALLLDPQNAKVKREIAQITDIYASMNRPIPSDPADDPKL
jgi:hypothetical protein